MGQSLMAHRKAIFWLVLAACSMASSMSLLGTANTPSDPPTAPGHQRSELVQSLKGVSGSMSCASQGCHGRYESLVDQVFLRSEATIWFERDPHSQAYEVLKSDRSRQIAENLNGPGKPAHLDSRCLACHANPQVAKYAEAKQDEIWKDSSLAKELDLASSRGTGVGCESCHTLPGHSTFEYLQRHTVLGPTGIGMEAWKSPESLRLKQLAGLANLAPAKNTAALCVSCHVGNPGSATEPIRDCNHDIMAAGHPRLVFDAASHINQLPAHWNTKREKDPDGRNAALHVAGLMISAGMQVRMATAHARNMGGIWPEFSDQDCFSCHAGLGASTDSWRQRNWLANKSGGQIKPGGFVPCNATISIVASLSEKPEMKSAVEAWSKAVSNANKANTAIIGETILHELQKLEVETSAIERLSMDKRHAWLARVAGPSAIALDEGRWDQAESHLRTLFWLSRGASNAPAAESFATAFSALAYPKGFAGPAGFRGPDRAGSFDPLAKWARKLAVN